MLIRCCRIAATVGLSTLVRHISRPPVVYRLVLRLFRTFILLMTMSSSSAVGGSSMWYLTGSCGMLLLAPSSTLVSGFSRRLKCSLHLSIILCFSVWSTLPSILFAGSKQAPCGPNASFSDEKNALGLFRSARLCISAPSWSTSHF